MSPAQAPRPPSLANLPHSLFPVVPLDPSLSNESIERHYFPHSVIDYARAQVFHSSAKWSLKESLYGDLSNKRLPFVGDLTTSLDVSILRDLNIILLN
jgi:hypothetical protein